MQASDIQSVFFIYCNGERDHLKDENREFRCTKGSRYRSLSFLSGFPNSYRCAKMINNRSLSRGKEGLKQNRRRNVFRPSKDTCPFNFKIAIDGYGYHVVNGSGNGEHCYHFKCQNKVQHNSTKFLKKDVKECVKKMRHGYSSNGSIRNIIFQETGRILSLPNIRYLSKKILHDTGKSNKEVVADHFSSVDKMVKHFEDNSIHYYLLLHSLQHSTSRYEDLTTITN